MKLKEKIKISNKEKYRTGFVSLIGAPNAGKSTLINYLVGEKISIVTHKSQTTRACLRGIFIRNNTQIIFLDTPGIFDAERFIDKVMVKSAWKSFEDSNIICLIYDASINPINLQFKKIINNLKNIKTPIVLILNKIDKIRKNELLPLISEFEKLFNFEKIFILSALKGNGIDDLLKWLIKKMPFGPFLYDFDDLTDSPLRLISSEILREKLFLNLHQEIPYNLIVVTERWVDKVNNSIEIYQDIYVSKKSHKAMIIGRSGSNIKRIGILARKEMESIFNKKVHLYIRVKIKDNCLLDPKLLQSAGLEIDA